MHASSQLPRSVIYGRSEFGEAFRSRSIVRRSFRTRFVEREGDGRRLASLGRPLISAARRFRLGYVAWCAKEYTCLASTRRRDGFPSSSSGEKRKKERDIDFRTGVVLYARIRISIIYLFMHVGANYLNSSSESSYDTRLLFSSLRATPTPGLLFSWRERLRVEQSL